MAASEREHIASVVKAFNALSAIADRPGAISAKELSAAMDAPLATVYHMLKTLTAVGAVIKGADRGYRLGPRIGLLADAYLEDDEPIGYLNGALGELANRTGETAYLSAWRHNEIEVMATAEGSHAVRVAQLQRGAHGNAHARAAGKLLLAYARPGLRSNYFAAHPLERLTEKTITNIAELELQFDRIREQGYSSEIEEFAVGVSCMAAPIHVAGRIVGAYTVSSPSARFTGTEDDIRFALLEACEHAAALFDGR